MIKLLNQIFMVFHNILEYMTMYRFDHYDDYYHQIHISFPYVFYITKIRKKTVKVLVVL